MATTTSYGTWVNHADDISVGNTVVESLGDYAHEYDTEGLTAAYADAINDALPPNVSLCGDEFIGPYHDADCDFDDYPQGEDGSLDIRAIIQTVDLWALIPAYEYTSYGTWTSHADGAPESVSQSVSDALAGNSAYADLDTDDLTDAYRTAINEALPQRVNLTGEEFTGPRTPAPGEFDSYPLTEDGNLNVKAIIDAVPFWPMVEKFAASA